MKKRMCKKNRGGFTLAETLIAVLILLMVAGIVAAGIPAASNALTKAVDASHAQLLLSTTMTSLRNELGSARSIVCSAASDGGGTGDGSGGTGNQPIGGNNAQNLRINYVDASGAKCVLESKPDGIYVTKEASPDSVAGDSDLLFKENPLVSKEAATSNLFTTFNSASYENGIVKIVGLKVIKKQKDGSELVLSDLENVAFEIEVIGRKG